LSSNVAKIAQQKQLTGAQLSLAWLLLKGKELGVTCVPIPGTTNLHHALDNIAAAREVELTKEEREQLEELATQVAGLRGDEKTYLSTAIEAQEAQSKI
jgi:aryl-alcohol dehydrogenase-like predicted oxidoreductase